MLVFCVDAERDRRLDVRLHACHVNEFVVSADTTCLCPDVHVYARASGLPDESFRKVIDATVSILKLDCPIDFV